MSLLAPLISSRSSCSDCPFDDEDACEELASSCNHNFDYYLTLAESGEASSDDPEVIDCMQRTCCYCDQGFSTNALCTEVLSLNVEGTELMLSANDVCRTIPTAFGVPLAENCTGVLMCISSHGFQ